MPEDLIETGFEIEKLSGPIEPRHHRLERIFLFVEKTVLVRPNDSIGRKSEIGGHVRTE
jgi:hypothetical protein